MTESIFPDEMEPDVRRSLYLWFAFGLERSLSGRTYRQSEDSPAIQSRRNTVGNASHLGMTFVGVVFAGLLGVSFFRLDELFSAPRRARVRARRVAGTDENGIQILSDPDGRLWKRHTRNK
jgi:hypothetical protein